jgi:hypothetical protein
MIKKDETKKKRLRIQMDGWVSYDEECQRKNRRMGVVSYEYDSKE